MRKAYLSVLRLIFVILSFILGIASALVLLVVGVYSLATNVTIDGLKDYGIIIDTSAVLDNNVEKPIRTMTIMDLIGEIAEVSSMADTKTLDDISEKYGLILPAEGESAIFDAMRVIPLSKLLSQEGLDTALAEVYIGDLLGYEKRMDTTTDPENPTEYWYDAENDKNVTGVDLILSDYSLYTIVYDGINVSDIMDSEPVGVFLGYEQNEYGEWVNGDNEKLEGPMAYVAGKYLSEVGDSLNGTPIGEILGYTKDETTGEWYKIKTNSETGAPELDPDTNEPVREIMSGTMSAFADSTFESLETDIAETELGYLLGYDKVDGIWYTEEFDADGNPIPATGIMKTLASEHLQHLGHNLETEKIGILMGYKYISSSDAEYVSTYVNDYPTGYWVNPDAGIAEDRTKPCSAFMQIMSDATLGTVDDLQDEITIGKLIPYEDRQTGFLSLLDENVTIDEIPEEVDKKFSTVTVKELADCGAISLTEQDLTKLDLYPVEENGESKTLATVTLNTFFSNIVGLLQAP